MQNKRIISICGPTGSAKSSLAVRIAKALNTEIINADSVQLFRHANVGSGKLSIDERQGVFHHLLDVFDPNESPDLSNYVQTVRPLIEKIVQQGRRALLCGGSNLYLKALLCGLEALPGRQDVLREQLEALSTEELYKSLEKVSAGRAAELHPNDRLRIIRALEIYRSGYKVADGAAAAYRSSFSELKADFVVIIWPRPLLYERINRRVSQMIRDGILTVNLKGTPLIAISELPKHSASKPAADRYSVSSVIAATSMLLSFTTTGNNNCWILSLLSR